MRAKFDEARKTQKQSAGRAIGMFELCLDTATACKDRDAEQAIYGNLAIGYAGQGLYDHAITEFLKAAEIA
eukprot:SAG31_NODE_37075_length_307_cov_1.225962_1_plen_70_part_10